MSTLKESRVSYIEDYFSRLLTAAELSDNIFAGTLPLTTDSEWEDMVLIEVNKMTDYEAYTQGSVSIYLYARPTGTPAVKNVNLLNKMEKKLDAAIADAVDDNYIISEQWRDSDYDDDRNFHYDVVNVSVMTRKDQRKQS